jgi:hypothetical protein
VDVGARARAVREGACGAFFTIEHFPAICGNCPLGHRADLQDFSDWADWRFSLMRPKYGPGNTPSDAPNPARVCFFRRRRAVTPRSARCARSRFASTAESHERRGAYASATTALRPPERRGGHLDQVPVCRRIEGVPGDACADSEGRNIPDGAARGAGDDLTRSFQRRPTASPGQQHDVLVAGPVSRLLVTLQRAGHGIGDGREHTIAREASVREVDLGQAIDVEHCDRVTRPARGVVIQQEGQQPKQLVRGQQLGWAT